MTTQRREGPIAPGARRVASTLPPPSPAPSAPKPPTTTERQRTFNILRRGGPAATQERERLDRERLQAVPQQRREQAQRNIRRFVDTRGNTDLVAAISSGEQASTLRDAGFTTRDVGQARRVADVVDELALIPGAVDRQGNTNLQVALSKGIAAKELRNAGFERSDIQEAREANERLAEGKTFKARAKSISLEVADAVVPGLWARNWSSMTPAQRSLNIAMDALFFIPFAGAGLRIGTKVGSRAILTSTSEGAALFGKTVARTQGQAAGRRASAAYRDAAEGLRSNNPEAVRQARNRMIKAVGPARADSAGINSRLRALTGSRRDIRRLQQEESRSRIFGGELQAGAAERIKTGGRGTGRGTGRGRVGQGRPGSTPPRRRRGGPSPAAPRDRGGAPVATETRTISGAVQLRQTAEIISRARPKLASVSDLKAAELVKAKRARILRKAKVKLARAKRTQPKTQPKITRKTQQPTRRARKTTRRITPIPAPRLGGAAKVSPVTATRTAISARVAPSAAPRRQPAARPSAAPSRQPAKLPAGQPLVQPRLIPARPPTKTTARAKPPGRPPSKPPGRPPPSKPPGRPVSKPPSKPPSRRDPLPPGVISLGVTNATIVGFNTGATDRIVNLKTGKARFVKDDKRIPEIASRRSFRVLARGKGGKSVRLRGGIVNITISPKDVRFGRRKRITPTSKRKGR